MHWHRILHVWCLGLYPDTDGTSKYSPDVLYHTKTYSQTEWSFLNIFATVMSKMNHGFIEAELCFIWNKFHTSLIEFAHERSQLGKLIHWVQICIVSNMQIRKYSSKATASHGISNEYIKRICSLFPEHTPSRRWDVTTQKNNSQKTFEFRASQVKIYIRTRSA